ncbi:cytosine deaminase [Halomonas elongata]|uniref:Cytosine deaminase n=1 Tax=Halomonas elongata TaxID=2746 RepID=A0A1B8P7H2_HALEL|nr:cytosine deaminase [Halomonas elongata]
MQIVNTRLRGRPDLYQVQIEQGRFSSISLQEDGYCSDQGEIDARGRLLCSPFIEPHIHLDAALTAGEPRWNESGTLFEGIECWSERKATLNREDIRRRALRPWNYWSTRGCSMCAPCRRQ